MTVYSLYLPKGFFPVTILSYANNETDCCSSVSLYSVTSFQPHCSYAGSSLILCNFFLTLVRFSNSLQAVLYSLATRYKLFFLQHLQKTDYCESKPVGITFEEIKFRSKHEFKYERL